MPAIGGPFTTTPPNPCQWPPAVVGQNFLSFHRGRMNRYWGRMKVLHATAHPANPRLLGKRKYAAMGVQNPMSYVLPGTSLFPEPAHRIVRRLKERRLPCVDYDTRGVIYAIFFTYSREPQLKQVYVGMTHKSLIERFEEHVREALALLQGARILMDGDALDLHKAMALHGINSCVAVPL